MELTVTAGLVGSVQLLSACEAQFAVPFPLRSRLAPSFESQTLPTLAHPWVVALAATRVFGPRAHSIFGQPSSPWTNTSCQNEKKKKKKNKKNPAPETLGVTMATAFCVGLLLLSQKVLFSISFGIL